MGSGQGDIATFLGSLAAGHLVDATSEADAPGTEHGDGALDEFAQIRRLSRFSVSGTNPNDPLAYFFNAKQSPWKSALQDIFNAQWDHLIDPAAGMRAVDDAEKDYAVACDAFLAKFGPQRLPDGVQTGALHTHLVHVKPSEYSLSLASLLAHMLADLPRHAKAVPTLFVRRATSKYDDAPTTILAEVFNKEWC